MNYYNSALQKIKCAQNTFSTGGCCCFGMTGPTGPTGPQGPAGPATITVGTTITGAPGTPATVTNVGTNENVILNFTIPQGVTGPTGATGIQGATGPQGETGPTGPAATFTVNPTITGEPGTNADVAIDGTDGDYTLTFTIPQGPTGATGNGLAAYGGLYATANQPLAFTGTTAQEIALANTMPTENVNATGNNVVVEQAGNYEITYDVTLSTTTQIDSLTFAVRQNDTDIPGTTETGQLAINTPTNYSGNVIVALTEGASVDLALTDAAGTGNVTIANASLTVKKLDASTTAPAA